ncbi:YggT family protein [Candidatus Peregrinibacteria bacterium CG_4_9_14_0_2_um_filter_53_11]|nr:MAG: YggT family protein [Candidatus Peregrinibacteria bacterium CG_4_9_14_0_2_um_filter_53_11]
MLRPFLENFINILANLLIFAIFARVLLSWLKPGGDDPFSRLVASVTDPILNLFKRHLPLVGGVLDLSPIVAYFVIDIARGILIRVI